MHILRLDCSTEEKDRLVAELNDRGTSGIIEHDREAGRVTLEAFFNEPFAASDFASCHPAWEPADETNWARIVMENWDPIEVGERFFIVPDWRDDPTPKGRIRLVVRPGLALGTGYHLTTQMCLEAMEQYMSPPDRFLDLGAGSGILSHAAWLLGVRTIIAADIDPQAIESARENLTRYGVEARLIEGSTGLLEDGCADFVVANISAAALIELAPEIKRCLSPRGTAVLSGFAPEQSGDVQLGYELEGFVHLDGSDGDEWACMVVRKATES